MTAPGPNTLLLVAQILFGPPRPEPPLESPTVAAPNEAAPNPAVPNPAAQIRAPDRDPAPPPAPQIDFSRIEAVLAALPPAPGLDAIQAAALERAHVDLRGAARWLQRARRAAAAPTLSLQYDHRLDRGWSLDREVGQADALREDAGQQGLLRAKATWELDRLIFNPDELRAAQTLMDVAELRQRILVEVTHLYFERQRLLVERELNPPTQLDLAIQATIRIRELEGLLTGLTGLEFSKPASRSP